MAERAPPQWRSVGVGLDELTHVESVKPLTPAYVTFADYPWLRALLDERDRFVGQRRREWRARCSEPVSVVAPAGKLRVALGVLDHLAKDCAPRGVVPRKLRAIVFREATKTSSRPSALARAATRLGLTPQAVSEGLFCDLPDERRLAALPDPMDTTEFALLCNEAIVVALLHKALRVRIAARGNVRAVVRHAKLTGLLCRAEKLFRIPERTGPTNFTVSRKWKYVNLAAKPIGLSFFL